MALSTRNCHTLCFLTFRRDSLTDFCTLQPPIFGVPNTISYLCRTKELFIIYPFCSYVILSFNMFLCQKICISVRSTGNLREMYGICWATSPASETLCGWAFQKSYGICCPIFQMSKDLIWGFWEFCIICMTIIRTRIIRIMRIFSLIPQFLRKPISKTYAFRR